MDGFSNLVPGEDYWLYSGGNISNTPPDANTGAAYKVARAVSTTAVVIEKGEKNITWTENYTCHNNAAKSYYKYYPIAFMLQSLELFVGRSTESYLSIGKFSFNKTDSDAETYAQRCLGLTNAADIEKYNKLARLYGLEITFEKVFSGGFLLKFYEPVATNNVYKLLFRATAV